LRNREKIVAVIAPAIAAEFPETYMNFNGWLKSIGISALFDVSFGAELTVKSYLEHIAVNKPKAVISQPCPAIVTYIEIFHPELLKYLAPADSPMMHTIKMIKEYYPHFSGHKVLIVSPCIAKKREFEEVGLGNYNVTMKKLKEYLSNEKINLLNYPKTDFDNDPAERAVLFSTPGGLLRTVQREFPAITNAARKIEGPSTIYHYLSNLEKDINKGIAPLLIDCLNCEHGCNGGTGTSRDKSLDEIENAIEKRNVEMQRSYKSRNIFKSKKLGQRKLKSSIKKYWKKDLYNRTYKDLSESNLNKIVKVPSQRETEIIFKELLKEGKTDILNCGGCGYKKCDDMAAAIYNGLNKKENCHHYGKKHFSGSVTNMLKEMKKFASGDLTVQLNTDKKVDEVGKFYEAFNEAMESIRNVLQSLIEAINATANASSQISSSSEEMAAGAQEQSSNTADVARAIDEMTKTIIETTKNSSSAAQAAQKAGMIAKDGGDVIKETIDGMTRIADVVKISAATVHALGESSNQIGEIVQVIDDIADQTNLLALNAAIEAARAGEQGRGFAVVADEVKKLAERTTKATKEIAVMIKQIQKDTAGAVESMERGTIEVEKGIKLADKAGLSLSLIIKGSEDVVDISSQVAAASEEQSSVAEQITGNIEAINKITNESSIGVQQIALSAEGLNQLTLNLQRLISRFKLEDNSVRARMSN
jgi:methyl-accepting chemotaxis protein